MHGSKRCIILGLYDEIIDFFSNTFSRAKAGFIPRLMLSDRSPQNKFFLLVLKPVARIYASVRRERNHFTSGAKLSFDQSSLMPEQWYHVCPDIIFGKQPALSG